MTVRDLHIYPCFGSLLYSPLYLAILLYHRRESTGGAVQDQDDATIWPGTRGNIWLHKLTTPGDSAAIEALLDHKPDESLAIAVADPTCALLRNDDRLVVLGTVLNRIALWAIWSRKRGRRMIANVLDALSARQDHTTLGTALVSHADLPHILKDLNQRRLKVGYWKNGFTTRFLMHFGCSGDLIEHVHFESAETELYDHFSSRRNQKRFCDVVFTNSPWLAYLHARPADFGHARWFPPVPFAFTSIVSRRPKKDGNSKWPDPVSTLDQDNNALRALVEHLPFAANFIYENPSEVAEELFSNRRHFSFYGLPAAAHDNAFVYTAALSYLARWDVLSADLSAPWPFWMFTTQALFACRSAFPPEFNAPLLSNLAQTANHWREFANRFLESAAERLVYGRATSIVTDGRLPKDRMAWLEWNVS